MNLPGPSVQQGFRAEACGRPSGQHIVDQQNRTPLNRLQQSERISQVAVPLLRRQVMLAQSFPGFDKPGRQQRDPAQSRELSSQQQGLVVTALA